MNLDLLISKKWFIQFRWYLSALCVGSYFAAKNLEIIDQSSVLLVLIAIILSTNIAIDRFTKESISEPTLLGLIFLDISIITVGLFYTGGASNPFSILYLVYIVFASILLNKFKTIFIAIVSIILYGLLLLIPSSAHHHHGHHTSTFNTHLIGMWFAYSLVAIICSFSISYLSSLLKQTLKEREALINKEMRLRSLTTLAAGAAHELRTPLNTVYLFIDELKENLINNRQSQDLLNSVAEIEKQIKRCTTIINDLNANSGQLEAEKRSKTTLEEFTSLVSSQLQIPDETKLSFSHTNPNEIVQIPIVTLSRSLKSLLLNALESKKDVNILLSTEITENEIRFMVEDNGPGITKQVLEHIGEPFITNKPPGNGMGLGLFISKLTANTYGGDLIVVKSDAMGTTIILTIKK